MSYNGAGIFQLVSGNPVVTGTLISSTWANNTLNDIANNGLSNCITKDGQQTVTANIPFSGFRATGLANGVNLQDAATVSQLQNNGPTQLVSVAGTDTITASATPTPLAYAAGQRFQFLPAGANTTTSVTLNIGALGAKSVLKPTQAGLIALAPGDIAAAVEQTVIYDGTQFQLQTVGVTNLGRLLSVQVFTSSATYTRNAGANTIIAEAQAPGGGSGGSPATAAGQFAGSSGASSGSYAKVLLTAAQVGASQSITIGAAGAAGAAGLSGGGNGGTVSVGSLISCPGGVGSTGYGPTGSTVFIQNAPTAAGTPTITTGTVINSTPGNTGGYAIGTASGGVASPQGGISPMTAGSSNDPGSGARGVAAGPSTGAQAGIAGGTGKVIIWEYA